MKPYEITYKILSSDTDADQRLRISRLFTFLQEAAIAHTQELGAGREKTLDKGFLWVVSVQQVKISRLPVYDETIVLTSLPGDRMHTFFPRYYHITDESEQSLISASALWMLMDAKERKMVQPAEAGIDIPGAEPDWETFLPAGPPLPKEAEEQSFTVPYSYVDLNGHMNHTRYFDLAEDSMPVSLRTRKIREIRCEFSGEAKEGDRLNIRMQTKENLFLMAGFREKRMFRIGMEYQ